jgi:membrane protease YdiL (CAAX protease family)
MILRRATSRYTTQQPCHHIDWRGITWYLIGAFTLSWSLIIGLRWLGLSADVRATIGMFGPALACVLVRMLLREGFADAGLRLAAPGIPRAGRWYLAAYLFPLGILFAGVGCSLLLGLQHWILPQTAQQFHLSPLTLTGILIALPVVIVGLVMIATFGEELGWRGYLLPRLLPLGGAKAALIVGLIWGIWHTPIILLDNHGFGSALPWVSVPLFTLVITLYSIFLTWLRLHSGSIWPAVLAHAVINTYVSFIFASFSVGNRYIGSPIGLVTLIPFAVVDLWLIVTGQLQARGILGSDSRCRGYLVQTHER